MHKFFLFELKFFILKAVTVRVPFCYKKQLAGVSDLLHHVVVALYFLYDPVLKIGCCWDCYGWQAGKPPTPLLVTTSSR
jgi:hypothetical protein